MIQKNEIIEGEVVDFALPECTGVLRQEGLVIFVPGVLPGERCRVIIKKVKKNLAEGEVSDILVSSPFRVSPPCPYFLDGCGGCSLQYIDYSEQVKIKEQNARVMLARLGGVEPGTYINDGFISSPRSLEYRNKMEFNFGEKNGRLLLGLRPKKRYWDLIDLSTCYLMNEEITGRLLDIFRWYGKRFSLAGYDPVRKDGILRNLLLRCSESSGEFLVGLATVGGELPGETELVEALRKDIPQVSGFVHLINNTASNALVIQDKRILWGEGTLSETIGFTRYRVSIESFFQVNTAACQLLYVKVAEYAEPQPSDTILDLYSGSGGIGLFLSPVAGKVVGVEENPQAGEDARENARLNGIGTYTVLSGRVEKVLPTLSVEGPMKVMVDPPRAGLTPRVVKAIVLRKPDRVIYVSCNTSSLSRDLQLFRDLGYRLDRITWIDLFPQTPHFEAVALLLPRKDRES